MKQSIFTFISLITVFTISCKKDKIELPYTSYIIDQSIDFQKVNMNSAGSLYASGGNDQKGIIYRSGDGGLNWVAMNNIFDKSINDAIINSDSTGFCADKDVLIYLTSDAGGSWQQYYPNDWPLSVNRNLRNICQVNDSLIFICGGKNYGNGLIYRSVDGGLNWDFSEFNHELRSITFNTPLNGVAVGYGVILRTNDGGENWDVIKSPSEYYMGVVGDGGSYYWACGFNGGIYRSDDHGNSWSTIKDKDNSISSRDRFTCIDRNSDMHLITCGISGLTGISKDNGESWDFYESFSEADINSVVIKSSGKAVAVGERGRIFTVTY